MSNIIIKAEDLGKSYVIDHLQTDRYATFRDSISQKAGSLFKKKKSIKNKEEFWALQHINFEFNRGDRIGVIGRNGAGKSTLLKLLSRITEPTTGKISLKGRVASLLEVGTGFHPELSGRENIFLNGAILGMTRVEIKSKFDEIVDFAGVEKFLDTPVKRYSSGMYVRLAFAVAAHLEPEILVVDEVLAVGDADFQKKSLGKMKDVSSKEGRTVLFVSHNMAAVENLCNKGMLLNKGKVDFIGTAKGTIEQYLKGQESLTSKTFTDAKYIRDVVMLNQDNFMSTEFEMGADFTVQISARGIKEVQGLHLSIFIKDIYEQRVASFTTAMKPLKIEYQPDINDDVYSFKVKSPNFLTGKYIIDISVSYKSGSKRLEFIDNAYVFYVLSKDVYGNGVLLNNYFGRVFLNVEPTLKIKG
ncbi:MAG: ABC transporter ATP-binding protein [Agriterribacter sp.]